MDHHSEVEVKFVVENPSHVTLREFRELVESQTLATVDRFKEVVGKDVYFVNAAGQPIRYREGDSDREAELTYKERKSADSILDRVEINIPLKKGAETAVSAFLGALGARRAFEINKISHIWHVHGKHKDTTYQATVVLYDVDSEFPINSWGFDRFVEVEIEADSECSPDEAKELLDLWTKLVQTRLYVKGPVNQSLYEIYSTRKENVK